MARSARPSARGTCAGSPPARHGDAGAALLRQQLDGRHHRPSPCRKPPPRPGAAALPRAHAPLPRHFRNVCSCSRRSP
eukprot:5756561-Lingulodinium_polyedra.AAC.1